MKIPYFQSDVLSKTSDVNHGFFGRDGGVSTGIYSSLNCGLGSDDAPEAIIENRSRVAAEMNVPATHLLSLYQHHSPDVVIVPEIWAAGNGPKADGMVTDQPGLALAITTADCVPVLFFEPTRRIIGAAHAGWRGALGGVLQNTVSAMVGMGADRTRIQAVVGPCIRQASYQVGHDVRDAFIGAQAHSNQFFATDVTDNTKFCFDLAGFVHDALATTGIGLIDDIDRDTYADADHFFSYRRTTHKKEADYGRSLSVIALAHDSGPVLGAHNLGPQTWGQNLFVT